MQPVLSRAMRMLAGREPPGRLRRAPRLPVVFILRALRVERSPLIPFIPSRRAISTPRYAGKNEFATPRSTNFLISRENFCSRPC
jgi:hypothetical protein